MTYEDEPFHAGGGHGSDLRGEVGPAVRVGQGARRVVRRHVTVELELEWQLHLSGRFTSDVTQIPSPYVAVELELAAPLGRYFRVVIVVTLKRPDHHPDVPDVTHGVIHSDLLRHVVIRHTSKRPPSESWPTASNVSRNSSKMSGVRAHQTSLTDEQLNWLALCLAS